MCDSMFSLSPEIFLFENQGKWLNSYLFNRLHAIYHSEIVHLVVYALKDASFLIMLVFLFINTKK